VTQLDEGMLISATYDGDLRKAILKFYDPKSERVYLWHDNTGHKPYCYTKLPLDEIVQLRNRKDILRIEEERKKDLLADDSVTVRKIVATDPLAIGGGQNSVRDEIRAWEADIKYYENYAYDKGLRMGVYYQVIDDKVLPVKSEVPERVAHSLEEVFRKNPPEFAPYLREWAELLGQPLCDFKRIALDIEVANEEGRIPDPEKAELPIIAVSFFNEKEKVVYALSRNGTGPAEDLSTLPYKTLVFASETELIKRTFNKMMDYPVVVTFNGDDFDLRYLKHRAEVKGIKEEEDPIQLMRQEAAIKHGIHLDLYRFFNNRSIQGYAFGNRYSEHTLNGVAEPLLGKSKMEFEGEIADLPIVELANYCLQDSQLAFELTSMSSSVVIKLLIVLSRIGKMPINDVARLGVSNWIRSMLFFEHRKMGALIPRRDELSEKGGASSQAIIKGKKYKGGLVIEPKPGVYFDVSVLDFASLVFDESIFVRKRQTGQVYKTKIGEFVETRLPAGTAFAAKEIGPTWDVLSFDYDTQQASWKTIAAVIRHPNHPKVLELVTESGRRVRITEGHSVITLDTEGKKRTVRGKDLKVGDYVIALSSFSAEQQDTRLDLLPFLRQLTGYDITRGGGGHGRTVILRAKQSHRRFVVPRYLPLTSELMWGLGYWVAEGWHGQSEYRVSLLLEASRHDIELAQSKFEAAGFRTWKSPSNTPGCSILGIGQYESNSNTLSSSIFAKLVVLWFGRRASEKKVPNWVLRLPLRMREAFVDGYYRGDGYNPTNHGKFVVNGKYKVGSYSQLLVDDIMSMGLMSGFHCISKVVGDPESFLTWSSDAAQTYSMTKRPPPELLARTEHVQSFAKTAFYSSHRKNPSRYGRVNRTSVETYKPAFEHFYRGNCHFEKIKEIRIVRNELPVYDISVRGSESFFNSDGLLLSNSLYPSLIKVHNLSYETVNCRHPECKTNLVPDTTHWVCTRRKGITSLVTGSLRDLRVGHYKPLARDTSLSSDERELYSTVSQGLKVFLNACFTGDTDIVTPQGIRNITNVKVGDEVVNINPDTLAIEIDKVVQVQEFPYRGELYHFNDRRFVDLMVTPNHRFLTIDRRKRGGAVFRTAEEVYNGTNIAIPKVRAGVPPEQIERLSLLETARKVGAIANLYPGGRRLSSWFRQLPPGLRWKIRRDGAVNKNRSKVISTWRSHYRLPASALTEEEIDQVEGAGGFVLLGNFKGSKIPARYDPVDFASLCGWVVSEGNPYSTAPRSYPNGHIRGKSNGITISQSFGKGSRKGHIYRREIAELIERLGIRHSTDSRDGKYFKIASPVLHDWIITNCYDEGSTLHKAFSKRVPGFVFESRKTMDAFFESAYKGDGSSRRHVYSTRSRRLAEDMMVIASLAGAKSKIRRDSGMFRVVFRNSSLKLTHSGSSKHKSVKKVQYEGTVYCVTTERNHTVIAGRNGRFVHVGQSYGVMGFETFAFYCLPVAEATAALGRDAITRTIEKCRNLGVSVVYSDTDSLFLQNPSKEQILTVTRWSEGELGVELDLDKTYRYVAFSSRKKNYFGVLADGTVDIRGLTGKKSQTPEFLKKAFFESLDILRSVYSSTDFENARARIRELLTTMIGNLKSREIPMQELAFNVMMGKPTASYKDNTPQHVKAAELLQNNGREIKAGEIISFVKTKTPPYVKPVELAKPDEIDSEKYVDYARSMFDQMLDALDFSFDEIMGATTLDLFWS
jgi:DNA polymerase elongation subunit (family B)